MGSRSPFEITLAGHERAVLERLVHQPKASYRDVVRARIVLLAATGLDNVEIATRLGTPREVVSRWRKRFFEKRLKGLQEGKRTGRPVRFSPQSRGRDQGACV